MAPRQGNVQKSVLQVQSCCFLLNSLASLSSDRILRSVIISTLTIALTGRLKLIEWSNTIISFSSRSSKRLCYYLSVQFSESVTATTTTAKKTFFAFFFIQALKVPSMNLVRKQSFPERCVFVAFVLVYDIPIRWSILG